MSPALPWFLLIGGGFVALLYWHPYRVWGFVAPALAAWAAGEATADDGDPTTAVVLAVAAGVAFLLLFRPFFELCFEPFLWVMYRVRANRPGLKAVPTTGPCLVIANHACWFDPIFLAKVLPRRITPMMTARFFDLPVMGFLMRRFGVIRVDEKPLKQGVPVEITAAIAALDRGECVVIFPEGYLRRTDDKPLRRFGRGVWQILSARPDTPVVACWVEGGWGSYTSYRGGPPTKGKRPDFRRPITVTVGVPATVAADVLADHMATRTELMRRVIEQNSNENGTRMNADRNADEADQTKGGV